ncbi:MAG: ABC transporter substrate-binding protein [Chloroflexota bacterium]
MVLGRFGLVAAALLAAGSILTACSQGGGSSGATGSAGGAAQPTSAAPAAGAKPTSSSGAAVSGEALRVALNTEITGAGSLTGDLAKKAADAAVDKINASGGVGGRPIELVVEDAQSSNQGALAALNKAGGEDKAIAMVGPVKSTQILAIEPRIRELEMPSFLGGTNPTFTQSGDPWLFRLRPTDALAGPAAADFAVTDLKLSRVGILHDSDAFGTTGADLVEQALKKAGKDVVRRESYKTGDKDFTAQLLSLKQANVDGLIMWGTNSEDDTVIIRQIREQGLTVKLIGSPSWSQAVVVSLAKDAVDGLYVVEDYFPGRTPESKVYLDAWNAKYKDAPDALSAWNWDALMIIQKVYPNTGGDKNKFRDAVRAIKEYKGAVGTISFDANGDGLHSVDIMQYKGTEPQYIRTVQPSVS